MDDLNLQPIYEATAFDHGFAPMRWDLGVEVAPQPNYCVELVATVYTGHGLGHTYRPDVAL